MNNIVGIVDLDGFTLKRKFYCRELGIIEIDEDVGESYHFDIGIDWNELTNKEQKIGTHSVHVASLGNKN